MATSAALTAPDVHDGNGGSDVDEELEDDEDDEDEVGDGDGDGDDEGEGEGAGDDETDDDGDGDGVEEAAPPALLVEEFEPFTAWKPPVQLVSDITPTAHPRMRRANICGDWFFIRFPFLDLIKMQGRDHESLKSTFLCHSNIK